MFRSEYRIQYIEGEDIISGYTPPHHPHTKTSQAPKHLKYSSSEFKHNLFMKVNGKVQVHIVVIILVIKSSKG